MNVRTLVICAGAVLACLAAGASAAGMPPALELPAGQALRLAAAARGVQIYACQADPKAAAAGAWVLRAPEAELLDGAGRHIGRHGAGPYWELEDGSRIVGEVVARDPGPDAKAIAWLLLRVKEHAGKGRLDEVQFVRRVDTAGGKAPAQCEPGQLGQELRVPYEARYEFFAPGS